jgi:hypothetical protein
VSVAAITKKAAHSSGCVAMVNYQLPSPTGKWLLSPAYGAVVTLRFFKGTHLFFCEIVFSAEVIAALDCALLSLLLWGHASISRPAISLGGFGVALIPVSLVSFLVELRQVLLLPGTEHGPR